MISPRESIYLGHLGPIPLYAHWSCLMMVYMAFQWAGGTSNHFDVQWFLVLLTTLVMGIVLHELGHGLTGKALGAFGTTITLWAFGGLCSSTRDQLPRRELMIVAAGPAVSFILAGIGYGGYELVLQNHPEWLGTRGDRTLLFQFLVATYEVNWLMGLFNILPIYPLDGGQIVYNLVLGVTGRQLVARQISLTLAVFGAFAYVAYVVHQNNNQVDQSLIYVIMLMGYLVYNAFRYLR
jgi:Zn-dependent protease